MAAGRRIDRREGEEPWTIPATSPTCRPTPAESKTPCRACAAAASGPSKGQVVLVLQGGGALGAYQAGVYEALHEAGIEPDWIIGTSIGAINASLIAGNEPKERLASAARPSGRRVEQSPDLDIWSALPWVGRCLPNWATMANGISGFFKPNPLAFLGLHVPLAPDAAGYYSTKPLETTLKSWSISTACRMRAHASPSAPPMSAPRRCIYFDSRDMPLTARHVMASGALPPAFPPIRIDGDLYWDGGILSNTPVEAVFDDNPRRNSLVFAVHIWNPQGQEPDIDLAGDEPAEGHPVFEPRRQPHHAPEADPPPAPRHRRTRRPPARGASGTGRGRGNGRLWLPDPHACRAAAGAAARREDHTKDIDFSRAGIKRALEGRLSSTRSTSCRSALGEGCRSDRGLLPARASPHGHAGVLNHNLPALQAGPLVARPSFVDLSRGLLSPRTRR